MNFRKPMDSLKTNEGSPSPRIQKPKKISMFPWLYLVAIDKEIGRGVYCDEQMRHGHHHVGAVRPGNSR
jgi:hypothetical protein